MSDGQTDQAAPAADRHAESGASGDDPPATAEGIALAEHAAYERQLAAWAAHWDRRSVHDIPDALLHHYPALLHGAAFADTVPAACRGLIWGNSTGDPTNSCWARRCGVQLFAVDCAGQALLGEITYFTYEDVDHCRYRVLALAEAIKLIEAAMQAAARIPPSPSLGEPEI